MFDQSLLDRIRAAVDIAEVVGEYVSLKKSGGHGMKGLCPFHKEKTPSFNVNTSLQIFKCFGCNASGNVFTFLSKIENTPFTEAVRRLAERTRIPIAETSSPEDRERKRLLQALETAATLYHQALLKSPAAGRARAYLEKRKVPKEAIEKFRIGHSSGREIFSAKLHPALLAKAGLAGESRDGGQRDRMRGRLVLPITDLEGRVIGFGGRALEEGQQPKYLNSPETPVYKKSNSLYAMSLAKDAIRKSGRAVLVEGYFDAIAPHARGISNVVAVLGTSLTTPQLRLLKRFAQVLLIVYDEDVSGNEAAVRSLDLASEEGFEVKIVRLPGGSDPDEFLIERGEGAFLKALEDATGGESPADSLQERGIAVSLFDFRFEVAARNVDPAALGGKKTIVASLLPFLARVPNAIERFAYVKRLAEQLSLREQDISEELEKFASRQTNSRQPAREERWPPVKAAERRPGAWSAERLILTGVLKHRAAAITALLETPVEAYQFAETRRLASHLRGFFEDGRSFSVASLMDEFQDSPAILDLLAASEAETGETISDETCRKSAQKLKRAHNRARLKAVQSQIERTTDREAMTQLLEEKQRLAMAN